jgi:hypothetical protein
MTTRTLTRPPSMLALYARSAIAMVPGTSVLPPIAGANSEIPDLELTLPRVEVNRVQLARYAEVCGFSLRDELPVTYPHLLAFPLQMALMADGSFPFGAVGLVHIDNRITQHRPIAVAEQLQIRVRATPLQPHPRGRSFSLLTEVLSDVEPVWEGVSRMLHRGNRKPAGSTATPPGCEESFGELSSGDSPTGGAAAQSTPPQPSSEWHLSGDLGRRYAAVSGDRNPIHLHPLSARAFGFPRAIAHGMWTKARCLAALESRLPEAYRVEVRFRKPILLPARVQFLPIPRGSEIDFTVKATVGEETHLEGRMQPIMTEEPQ